MTWMSRGSLWKSCLQLIALALTLSLTACGGGGGGGGGGTASTQSHTISGTAAAGAPVVGHVSVYDSSGNPQPVRTNVPIDANGNYSVDVAGLTAPYAFLASGTVGGRSVSLYSAATSSDVGHTIDITPFTDLMIRNIAASAVGNYVDGGGLSGLTAAQLDAQRVALTNELAPALTAMGLSSSIDLLRATFNADDTGLDAFMDVVRVSVSGSTATITNIMDAAKQLVIDTSTGATTGTLGTAGLAASGTPLQGIKQTFDALTALFANQLPSPTDPALLALFTNSFLNDGQNLAASLAGVTTNPANIGIKFTNLVIDSLDTTNGLAQVSFTMVYPNGLTEDPSVPGGAQTWQMKKVGGVWKLDGNQRIASVYVSAEAFKLDCIPASTGCTAAMSLSPSFSTGLSMYIDNSGSINLASAVVTGPGLSAGGVTLQARTGHTDLQITTSNALCDGTCGQDWWMSDTDIGAMPSANATYKVKLYDSGGNLLATYTEVVPAPPPLNTSLATLPFPSLSNMVSLTGLSTATLTPSWTMPSGIRPGKVMVELQATNGETSTVEDDLKDTASGSGTSTLAVSAPTASTWTGGYYNVYGYDSNACEHGVVYVNVQ